MFQFFNIRDGILIDSSQAQFPYIVRGLAGSTLPLESNRTHVGMVSSGQIRVSDVHGNCRLGPGTFFCVQGAEIEPMVPEARALIISGAFFSGLRMFGGPLEGTGRLNYVDGCSDTLLLAPSRKGEPCLNHLHIPPRVPQRRHYHPSDRVGIILRGSGVCHTDDGDFALAPGAGWRISAGMNHCFETGSESLDVIAWHPDSDFGPTDEDHPMINRTWVR